MKNKKQKTRKNRKQKIEIDTTRNTNETKTENNY